MKEKQLEIKKFNLKLSSLIEASAGTGKTYTISYLVLRLLLGSGRYNDTAHADGPLSLDNILIVTFTEKATADLKARVREKIRYARLGFEAYLKNKDEFETEKYEQQLIELIEEFDDEDNRTLTGALQILKRAERSVDTAPIYTIHSFCNQALNRIYAFETGEAFENEFAIDISKYQKEASQSMWRYLFYPESDRLKLISDRYLHSNDPYTLFKKYNDYLEKVMLPDKKAGFLGYKIIKKPILIKARTPLEALDELVAYIHKEDPLRLIKDLFSKHFGNDTDTVTQILRAIYDPKGLNGDGYALKTSDKSLIASNRSLKFLQLVDMALENIDSIDLASAQEAMDNFFKNHYSEPYQYFVDNIKVRSLKSAGVADAKALEQSSKYFYDIAEECVRILNTFKDVSLLINLVIVMCIREKVELLCKRDKVIYSNDVLMRLYSVLNTKDSGDALARLLRQRYRVAMIDEFQDTDPIQFNIFKKLYLNYEAMDNGAACYLIGDPKQSIYEFRGSDINSYLQAKYLIMDLQYEGGGDGLLTLKTNYRSTPDVIKAVNAIFSDEIAKSKKNTFINDDIEYIKVGSVTNSNWLEDNGPVYIGDSGCVINCIATNLKGKAAYLKRVAASRAARDILHLLNHGTIVKNDKSYKVQPGDIAVLVSSGSENDIIASELAKLNVPSVYYSDRQSVLTDASGENAGEDARNILYLMQAMIEPTRRSTLNRLLGSRLLGLYGSEFNEKRSDEHYEHEIELLNKCRIIWEKSGFLTAFATWYLDSEHECLKRRLSEHGGLRRISNLYQIAEIVQGVHNTISGVMAQMRYLVDLIQTQDTTQIADGSTLEKRLDTQRDQVKVLTIHKSKGLEFPIVVMPFLWFKALKRESGYQSIIPYYSETDESYIIGFDAQSSKESRDYAAECENRRLLYVALTRARYVNYMYALDTQKLRNYVESPINALLSGGVQRKDAFEFTIENLKKFCENSDSITLNYLSDLPNGALRPNEVIKPYEVVSESDNEFTVGSFDSDSIDRRFVFTSYSAITKQATLDEGYRASLLKNDENYISEVFADYDGDTEKSVILSGMAHSKLPSEQCFNNLNYPKGAVFGTIMHNIFEKTVFEHIDNGALTQAIAEVVLKEGDSNAIKLKKSWLYACPSENYRYYGEHCVTALSYWFEKAVEQDLLKIKDKSYALCDLKCHDYIPEMQFLMPCSSFSIEDFNALCKKEAKRVFKGMANTDFIEGMALKREIIDGYLNGSLDLVLRFEIDNDYKYYVLDYKSNYLGQSLADYRSENIARVIFNEHHRYDVQYLIYTVVLHRYLKLRLKDYDYNRHMGGILYLFVRGMGHDSDHGVFHTRVDYDLILQIEELLYDKE